jgi:hypothetical protein
MVDTPGQIEIFTWSASGAIVTESFASTFPTCVLFVGGVGQTFLQFLVLLQSTHQLITASIGHVTNLTPPAVSNPRRAFGRRHRLLTAGIVHVSRRHQLLTAGMVNVTNPYDTSTPRARRTRRRS